MNGRKKQINCKTTMKSLVLTRRRRSLLLLVLVVVATNWYSSNQHTAVAAAAAATTATNDVLQQQQQRSRNTRRRRRRNLTKCGTLDACFLVNIATKTEIRLTVDGAEASTTTTTSNNNVYYPSDTPAASKYNIRCDTVGTIHKVSYKFSTIDRIEYGAPWFMGGDDSGRVSFGLLPAVGVSSHHDLLCQWQFVLVRDLTTHQFI
jgi:hypothetical protein